MSDPGFGQKIFLDDPYITDLTTEIESSRKDEAGIWYTFKNTIFYPEGGGQDADRGFINNVKVLDVQSQTGQIWHLLETVVVNPVIMKVDWERRYTNMQQHTGQHILSACFKQLHNLETVSVHLGREITMIELNTAVIEQDVLYTTESMANQIIRMQIPINSVWTTKENLQEFNLRRPIKKADHDIRLIEIGDLDCVGCGGTHVRSTAEIGYIKIIGFEKIRNHIRVKIKIGTSAADYFSLLHQTLLKIGNVLTTSVEDLPRKISLLLAEKKEILNKLKTINDLWTSEYAKNLNEENFPGCFYLENLDKGQLKNLSEKWLSLNTRPCLFVSREGRRTHFCLRYPLNFNLNAQDFIRKQRDIYGLKGGGSKDFAVGDIIFERSGKEDIDNLFHQFCQQINQEGDK